MLGNHKSTGIPDTSSAYPYRNGMRRTCSIHLPDTRYHWIDICYKESCDLKQLKDCKTSFHKIESP